DAAAGVAVDQQGQADETVHPLQRGQRHVADVRDARVDGLPLRQDRGVWIFELSGTFCSR
ncbi:MAG TPA: hypothetical protein VIJ23_05905, partial [Mycobacterium sp.]